MLFNILSFLSDKLLTEGNTVAALDELYIWLSNPTAIEYIRNCLKRVRKKESAMLLASQNLEDFDQEGIREMTKPLFSIPPHQFLFNAGSIDKRSYMEMLQLDEAEYNLIKFPQRGVCLYKCGNERYLRVAADGSNRRYARQSRGNSPFQREAPQRDRLGAGRCSLARHPPDRRAVLHRHRRCGSQQPGGSRSLLWDELFVRGAYGIPLSHRGYAHRVFSSEFGGRLRQWADGRRKQP